MRRLFAVVAVLFLSACSDRHAQGPFGPFGSPPLASTSDGSRNAGFWLLGETWTVNGTTCTFVENHLNSGLDGALCGDDDFYPWAGANNTELYPVVEICRLVGEECSIAPGDTASFVRKTGEIDVPNPSNGKYELGALGEAWWNGARLGETYRIIVAITFTGGEADDPDPPPGWNVTSPKVLGYFDKQRKSNPSAADDLKVRFRIAEGALCEEPNPADCVQTAFDPDEEYTLILDDQFNQYNEDESPGVVGIKFPALGRVLQQQRINVILERVTLGPNDKCLEEQPASGKEVGPCYRVRTEPYIDLAALGYTYEDEEYLIKFVICYDDPELPLGALLKMWKWSYVKTKLQELPEVDSDFIDCDGGSASADHASPRHLAGFGGIRSRLKAAAASVLLPAPLHARRRTSRFGGGMLDLSAITLVQSEDIQANFTTPLAGGTGFDDANLGELDGPFTVKVQCLTQVTGTCGTAISVPDTAGWDAVNQVYQVNWNTSRAQPAGEYEVQVYRDGKLVAGSAQFSIRSSGSGPSAYTHNPGRTLPIKFFLSALE
jgi:hypothetical protein